MEPRFFFFEEDRALGFSGGGAGITYSVTTDEDADHEACNGAAVGLTAVIFGIGDTVFFAVLKSRKSYDERIVRLVLVQCTDMIVVLLVKGA